MNITSVNSISGTSYPSGNAPDLSAIVDDTTGKYTDAQKTTAFGERQARDSAIIEPAVAASIANGDGTLPWRAALALLNSLSPAEQNSPRYAGTRQEIMLSISTNDGPSPWKSGAPGVEQIDMGVPTNAKATAAAAAKWRKFVKGEDLTTVTSALVTKKASAVLGDVLSPTSVSRTPASVSLANNTSSAFNASTHPETADVPLGKAVDTKA